MNCTLVRARAPNTSFCVVLTEICCQTVRHTNHKTRPHPPFSTGSFHPEGDLKTRVPGVLFFFKPPAARNTHLLRQTHIVITLQRPSEDFRYVEGFWRSVTFENFSLRIVARVVFENSLVRTMTHINRNNGRRNARSNVRNPNAGINVRKNNVRTNPGRINGGGVHL